MEVQPVTILHLHHPGRSSTAPPHEAALLPSQKVWTRRWTPHLCHLQTLGWRVGIAVAAVYPRVEEGEHCVGEMATGSWSCCRQKQGAWKAGASRWNRRPKTTSSQRRVRTTGCTSQQVFKLQNGSSKNFQLHQLYSQSKSNLCRSSEWSILSFTPDNWPHRTVQSCVTGFCLRPYNHSIRHPQHGGDEAVIPGVATHKQACNPQNYTNLLWNWLNLQIRLVLQHQPERAYSSKQTQIYTVHTKRQREDFGCD